MNIGRRIGLGFGCVIAIAVLLGAAALLELSDIDTRANRMGDDHLPGLLRPGVDGHRRPDLGVVVREMEGGGQHANDGELPIVEDDRFPGDVRAPAELARPQLLADDRNLVGSGAILVGRKQTALNRGDAEHREERRRDRRAAETHGFRETGECVRARLVGGESVQRARALTPVLECAAGDVRPAWTGATAATRAQRSEPGGVVLGSSGSSAPPGVRRATYADCRSGTDVRGR